jgi:hypothetical protein
LREALESVRRQTARRAIARVIVSENSTNGDSREVCSHFKDLPIVYVQQKPPVPAMLHMKVMWDLVQSPLAAILYDDDWWAPDGTGRPGGQQGLRSRVLQLVRDLRTAKSVLDLGGGVADLAGRGL